MHNDDTITLYTAADSVQASLLVDMLEQQGIRAMVVNENLQAGAAELVGYAAQPRIVVFRHDAERARTVAKTFDDQLVAANAARKRDVLATPTEQPAAAEYEGSLRTPDTLPAWPLCPECRRPRHTMCEACGTAGSDFLLADPPPHVAEDVGNEGGDREDAIDGDLAGPGAADAEPALRVICPTCDEPFVPVFLRRCQWCGHDFGEGRDYEVPPTRTATPDEAVNYRRVLLVTVVLMVVLAALATYFAVIAGR